MHLLTPQTEVSIWPYMTYVVVVIYVFMHWGQHEDDWGCPNI